MWKNFKYAIKLFEREHGAMFQKLEDRTSSVVLEQKDKAVKAIEKIEASCAIKLANCKEELTKQQLMHIQEEHTKLVTHTQQYNSERLKDLRQKTITMSIEVATVFKELGDRLEVKGQILEEKLLPYKQCILQHKEDEKKLADQISKVLEQSDNDMIHTQEKHTKLITQMKQDHSEQLKCLKEKTITTWTYFEDVMEALACGLEDKCQKLENQFSSDVLVEEDKAVKDIEEIKESHDKILADCKEEPTRQQLLHILEEHTKLVTRMQQDQREQLKSLRQETIAMWEYFANEFEVLWIVLDCEGRILEDEVLQPEVDDDESLEADELLLLLLKE
ncbi:hypothetical protein P8452_01948 [Trifolium repens]|nr:hypothetical protein P8452_01948 [Trifolium repens]